MKTSSVIDRDPLAEIRARGVGDAGVGPARGGGGEHHGDQVRGHRSDLGTGGGGVQRVIGVAAEPYQVVAVGPGAHHGAGVVVVEVGDPGPGLLHRAIVPRVSGHGVAEGIAFGQVAFEAALAAPRTSPDVHCHPPCTTSRSYPVVSRMIATSYGSIVTSTVESTTVASSPNGNPPVQSNGGSKST